MTRLLTSESVTGGHPDKLADQISDGILDAHLGQDPYARVACETALSGDNVWIFGEITSTAKIDAEAIARQIIREAGYTSTATGIDPDTCSINVGIREQSPDIAQSVIRPDEIGAGDQGIVYGYASSETPELMPLPISLAHTLAARLSGNRILGTIPGLRPDGKTQVTVAYDQKGRPEAITAAVISAQHDEGVDVADLRVELEELIVANLPSRLVGPWTELYVNPSGRFVLGGPAADAGLTGRKIIVDTYGGAAHHGGGAFSGKDATKVDRSAAYAARQAAKSVVASGLAERCEIAIAYGIGLAEPIAINVDTFGTGRTSDERIAKLVNINFDFRPGAIIERLGLRAPIFRQTATFGHFGRAHLPWEKVKELC